MAFFLKKEPVKLIRWNCAIFWYTVYTVYNIADDVRELMVVSTTYFKVLYFRFLFSFIFEMLEGLHVF